MNDRDLQSKIAVIMPDGVVVTQQNKTTDVWSTFIIDMAYFRNLTIVPYPNIAYDPTDIVHFICQESADLVTWTDCNLKQLPGRHVDADGQVLFNAVFPYYQTIGIVSTERYIMIGCNAEVLGAARTYTIPFVGIKEAESQDFLVYDNTAPAVPPDTMP
jgi:hypothetical protein